MLMNLQILSNFTCTCIDLVLTNDTIKVKNVIVDEPN